MKRYKNKLREPVMYLIFGGFTTLVNFVVYLAVMSLGHVTAAGATALAWVAAVTFAYITNGRFVFGCEGNILSFFGTRICSGLAEVLLMAALVDGLHLGKLVTKLAVGVIVTAMNYLGSKLLVFRKSGKEQGRQPAGPAADPRDQRAAGQGAAGPVEESRAAL